MKKDINLNRREFLKAGGAGAAAAAVAVLPGCSLGAQHAGKEGMAAAGSAHPIPLPVSDAFNYAVGTQTIGASYQFTDKPRLVETAEAIREMGASAIKFRLDRTKRRGAGTDDRQTLREIAAHDPVVRQILDMPFGHYLLWAYPLGQGPGQSAAPPARDQELYDLCCYLLKTYDGSGKTFYLGHWEGDWELRKRAGSLQDPTPESIANKIRWLNRRQRAVDDAKRDTPHHGVEAFCYAEANRVRDSMKGQPGMANAVIPHTQIDYVSYSSYDTSNDKDAETEVPRALDYIESKLPPKPGINGKRVWIGEYGYPACRHSPQEQADRSRRLIKTALQWGCPLVLYWEIYNNEVDKDGTQRGFWLIDDKGVKQPVYYLHQRLLQWARGYVAEHLKTKFRLPAFDEYRQKAVEFLDAYRE
jgi:hypothetical protein